MRFELNTEQYFDAGSGYDSLEAFIEGNTVRSPQAGAETEMFRNAKETIA